VPNIYCLGFSSVLGVSYVKVAAGEFEPGRYEMRYSLRPLHSQDAGQATQIEKDAFPTQWPSTAFRREAQNRLAKYLVASEIADPQPEESPATDFPNPPQRKTFFINRFAKKTRDFLYSRSRLIRTSPDSPEYLVGFVGVLFLADEAHITGIGVRTSHRGLGIGELLLIGAIELADQRSSNVVTLEVRASNYVAQSLYRKYLFEDAGIRKGYYVDNNEDALIMTSPVIQSSEYRCRFLDLVRHHSEQRGESIRLIGEPTD
jgi:ribosomal-protein-alanine N-acetyltransferase